MFHFDIQCIEWSLPKYTLYNSHQQNPNKTSTEYKGMHVSHLTYKFNASCSVLTFSMHPSAQLEAVKQSLVHTGIPCLSQLCSCIMIQSGWMCNNFNLNWVMSSTGCNTAQLPYVAGIQAWVCGAFNETTYKSIKIYRSVLIFGSRVSSHAVTLTTSSILWSDEHKNHCILYTNQIHWSDEHKNHCLCLPSKCIKESDNTSWLTANDSIFQCINHLVPDLSSLLWSSPSPFSWLLLHLLGTHWYLIKEQNQFFPHFRLFVFRLFCLGFRV